MPSLKTLGVVSEDLVLMGSDKNEHLDEGMRLFAS